MAENHRLLVGCMRLNLIDTPRGAKADKNKRISELPPAYSEESIDKFIKGALDNGIDHFDHADIYGGGLCETLFGEALKRLKVNRKSIWLQSKCGIDKSGDFTTFDFSKDYILNAVDGTLQRLGTDYLDSLLLHRPDALVEPEEVAEAFDTLYKSGKVKKFGVSNMTPNQIELIQSYTGQKISYNQVQLSPAFHHIIDQGILFNTGDDAAVSRDLGILDYCRLHRIRLQAWSPFQFGNFEGTFIGSSKYKELNKVLEKIGEKYNASKATIATAWLLRHPANIQVVSGTMNLDHLLEMNSAQEITLTRDEWYEIYTSSGSRLP
jgi:predicted oxidoreductase